LLKVGGVGEGGLEWWTGWHSSIWKRGACEGFNEKRKLKSGNAAKSADKKSRIDRKRT